MIHLNTKLVVMLLYFKQVASAMPHVVMAFWVGLLVYVHAFCVGIMTFCKNRLCIPTCNVM